MQTTRAEAEQVFAALPPGLQAPTLHPAYIEADARRDRTLEPVFWCYREGGEVFYQGVHRCAIQKTSWFDIQSAYGYGGPLASTEDPAFLARAWEEFSAWCATEQIVVEFTRFHPLLPRFGYPGEVMQNRETVWIDLSAPDLLGSYDTRARTAVRKAQKAGLQVVWPERAEYGSLFPPFYREAMAGVQAEEFYRFGDEYFAAVFALPLTRLAVCKLGSEVVSAALFLVGPEMMEYDLAASTQKGRQTAAANLVLHAAAVMGRGLGCTRLHLGGGTDSDPQNRLLFFKAGFSSKRANFVIGKNVYSAPKYEQLKQQFSEAYRRHPKRVLFYR